MFKIFIGELGRTWEMFQRVLKALKLIWLTFRAKVVLGKSEFPVCIVNALFILIF